MRELSNDEIAAVSGGLEAVGFRPGFGSSPAGALLVMSFYVGYRIGTFMYNSYTTYRY